MISLPDSRWVVPRHLAGDDGTAAERVGAVLTDLGWRMWPTAHDTLLYVSPTGLRAAEWTLASPACALDDLPVAWQISARLTSDAVMAEWSAYFTSGVPPEAIADLVVALEGDELPITCSYRLVLSALFALGWARDVDRPETAAVDPTLSTVFSLEPLPPLLQDADPTPDLPGWQAWAEPAVGAALWCASFSPSVPHDLVAVFAASLASPAPVLRHSLPEGARHLLQVVPSS
ncbi:DUF317 domain-containing protein [Streptomyces sp. MS19]|uniref:DUF317 domain-containing protein n=1 Tax=Streptomyces sp. MS19 TaxID=3385972 RepID=UPI0039A2A713